jgi:hypothetical protein
MKTLARRILRLQRQFVPRKRPRVVYRFEGPGSEGHRQPTQEELEQANQVITLVFVPAKDGRPATPEEIARGDTSQGATIADTRLQSIAGVSR